MAEEVKLTVHIDNFKGIEKCPYCKKKPIAMEWGDDGLRIWCRTNECSGKRFKIFTPILPEEKDLVEATRKAIDHWNTYCKKVKERLKVNG